MRTKVTAIMLVLSTAFSVWLYWDSSSPFYKVMHDYSPRGIAGQLAIDGALICFSYAVGRMFRR